jgi:L-fucose isomerase-like protein
MIVKPVVGLYGVLEKTEEGWEDADSTVREVERQLKAGGLEVRTAPELVVDDASAEKAARSFSAENPDLLMAVVITWSFDHLSVRILKTVNRPLAILAIPGLRSGSIVGAHQLGSLLTDLGMERAVFFGDVGNEETYRPILAYARAAAVKRRLDTGKIAFVGRRTPGMTAISFDELELMRTFGCQVLSYGWEEIYELVKNLDPARIDAEVEELRSQVGSVTSSGECLREVVALYLALKDLGQTEGIVAYGLGCYPHLAGTVCLVTGLLGEDGLPAACEGDMNAGLLMYLIQALTGEPVHFGEILDIDRGANTILTSHCGCAAPSLAAKPADISLVPVRIWERGVCIRFPAKAAPQATYINLVGGGGNYRLCVSTGSAIETGMVFEGNPVRFKPDCSWQRLLQTIDEHGFGHHWMMGYRDIAEELRIFCRLIHIKGIFLGENDR